MTSQKIATHADEVEVDAWGQAAFVVMSLAALVFLVQRLFGPVFEIAFEICVFYIPAVAIALLYLYFRTKLSVKS